MVASPPSIEEIGWVACQKVPVTPMPLVSLASTAFVKPIRVVAVATSVVVPIVASAPSMPVTATDPKSLSRIARSAPIAEVLAPLAVATSLVEPSVTRPPSAALTVSGLADGLPTRILFSPLAAAE